MLENIEQERLELLSRKDEIMKKIEFFSPKILSSSQLSEQTSIVDKRDYHWDYVMKEMVMHKF